MSRWTTYATNVTITANRLIGSAVPLQGLAFAFQRNGFTVPNALSDGLLNSTASQEMKWCGRDIYLDHVAWIAESNSSSPGSLNTITQAHTAMVPYPMSSEHDRL